jgi:hypothetical protein
MKKQIHVLFHVREIYNNLKSPYSDNMFQQVAKL